VMRGVHELAHLTVTLTAGSRQYRVPLPARSAFPTELRIEWSGADHVTRTRSLPLR
jgi:hypothetical protein